MLGWRTKTFLHHFGVALIAGLSSTFGWGGVVGASVLAAIAIYLKMDQVPAWLLPIASAVIALLLVFFINLLIVAPYRAFRMMRPFSIKIESGFIKSQYPLSHFDSQKVAIRIKNRSYRPRSECVLHITSINNFENTNHVFPRFVEKFSIQPGDTTLITLASWTSRKLPSTDDSSIAIAGAIGRGYGGNVLMLPCDLCYDVAIRIGIPEGVSVCVYYKMWIEDRVLRAIQI
jgi:hypothetical protein